MVSKHGGKRTGSGRRKLYKEPVSRIICPEFMVKDVKNMIAEVLEFSGVMDHANYISMAAKSPTRLYRPLALSKVPAGFPSPADDYIESQLDLNEFFVQHPSSSFYWKVSGESMNLSGILDGSILLIDRSLEAAHNDIVLAIVNGDVTVKRFIRSSDCYELRPESNKDEYQALKFKRGDNIEIWGVVSAVFNKLR
ncbi:MAG: LexA family protein [Alphaproteobacteria bacterium]|jgi:DNA polymerase V|nr:translesion error-prone DNA polymerase V autoproteolytic subunit [Candidatus Jidaibacter sp.]